ncbi:MAG TPA: Gfo/Idh/MocA family oxidoreductase [Terriglobales bacterium]|nr:Gfo/Idh/MocA family oxidoreductase [Terriglobales bacterium]
MPPGKKVGYVVVGLGSISQVAVLPAFAHSEHAELVALVSGDKAKAEKLAQNFKARHAYSYVEYADCLKNPEVEAIYIATPPGEHEKYAVAAARAGKHVLCEKPLAANVQQARKMVDACRRNKVQFMTAYRKYFEPSTVTLKKMITKGDLGRIDVIHTLFGEFRPFGDSSPAWLFSRRLCGGGPLMDLGVYCINTSRWLVGEDPIAAEATSWVRDRRRYKEVEEGITFRLDFPSGLILQGTAAYSSVFSSFVHVHGEKGWAALSPAFAFEEERRLSGKIGGQWFENTFAPIDEFALELDSFASCVREGRKPEPDGGQGLRDIIIIDAIYKAAKKHGRVKIKYK